MSNSSNNNNSNDENNERGFHKDPKDEQLEQYRESNTGPGEKMTDDNGVRVSNDQTTLRAGRRGPGLLEDFHFYKNRRILTGNEYQKR